MASPMVFLPEIQHSLSVPFEVNIPVDILVHPQRQSSASFFRPASFMTMHGGSWLNQDEIESDEE